MEELDHGDILGGSNVLFFSVAFSEPGLGC